MDPNAQNVLRSSASVPEEAVCIEGYDFNSGINWTQIMDKYLTTGIQATQLGLAIGKINEIIETREKTPGFRFYLGYTSNMVSSGLRDIIRFLVQHNYVDVIVSTAGGIEEDLIKCLGPTICGSFGLSGEKLRNQGLNRIGNMILPNNNYCRFEDFLTPVLDGCLKEQRENKTIWTPSTLIHLLGEKINDPRSIYYWAYKNKIPVYSPALTDGSIGDMVYFHSIKNPGLILDLVQDIRGINESARTAVLSAVLVLGGGLVKHHICNANLIRNGADYAVFINSGSEFDASDSGADPDEAVSWGKIKPTADPIKIHTDATLVFPILVARTFARHFTKQSVV